ncbi:hypothetical protein L9F63_008910, partial [Diploptera punctata]
NCSWPVYRVFQYLETYRAGLNASTPNLEDQVIFVRDSTWKRKERCLLSYVPQFL